MPIGPSLRSGYLKRGRSIELLAEACDIEAASLVATIDRYTTLAAEQWLAEGRRTSGLEILIHPRLAFLRNYLLRGGVKDGAAGLIVSRLNAYYVFLKFAKLWELQPRAPADKRRKLTYP